MEAEIPHVATFANLANGMKADQYYSIECFRIMDTVLTKVVEIQQLHMNLIWECCSLVGIGPRKAEKQRNKCKQLETDIVSLRKRMVERFIVAYQQNGDISTLPSHVEKNVSPVAQKELYHADVEVKFPFVHNVKSEVEQDIDVEYNISDYVPGIQCGNVNRQLNCKDTETVNGNKKNGANAMNSRIQSDSEHDNRNYLRPTDNRENSKTVLGECANTPVFTKPEITGIYSDNVQKENVISSSIEHNDACNTKSLKSEVKVEADWNGNSSDCFDNCTDAGNPLETCTQSIDREDLQAIFHLLPNFVPAEMNFAEKSTFNNENFDSPNMDEETNSSSNSSASSSEEYYPHKCTNKVARKRAADVPYTCKVCKKQFKEKGNMTTHMRTHTGEKPYKCKICCKPFTQSNNLATHMRIHSGEKPYICTICAKGFAQSSSLNVHMRTHNNPQHLERCMRTHGGEKRQPYKCEICGKQFIQSGALVCHIRTHTGEKPYRCEECKKSFTRSCSLMYHMRTHNGEKPFKCKICEKQFRHKLSLTTHLERHKRDVQYKCDMCGRSFILRKHLMNHMVEVHRGKNSH